MKNNHKIIIFLYNRFFDPLIQSNFWLYIKDYLNDPENNITFHVITYEDSKYPLTEEQIELINKWQQQGLEWTRLTWHPGTGLLNKLRDLLAGLLTVTQLRTKQFRLIVTLGSVAGTYAYVYSRILGLRLFLYQFEPHSEYAIDNGMWSEKGLQYKISHLLERRAAEFATAIASGTRFMQERLKKEWQVKAAFFKLPTVANDKKFLFSQALRDETRSELGFKPDQWVLLYPGKFGSLYYYEETACMYKWLKQLEPRLHFLVVTPQSDSEVMTIFNSAGVDSDSYTIMHSDYEDIHRYYFAADFAVIAVPPGPSKKFISNVKVGEYLCAGLPFLITRGISEDYWYAENKDIGVVVDDFRGSDIKNAWPKIKYFLEMPPEKRRNHCRQVGLDYRGFENLIQF